MYLGFEKQDSIPPREELNDVNLHVFFGYSFVDLFVATQPYYTSTSSRTLLQDQHVYGQLMYKKSCSTEPRPKGAAHGQSCPNKARTHLPRWHPSVVCGWSRSTAATVFSNKIFLCFGVYLFCSWHQSYVCLRIIPRDDVTDAMSSHARLFR